MADAYPELREHAAEIERVVKQEEERFRETLARGLKVFEELAGKDAISADDAFVLATTYGFPIELTQELAEERGQAVDIDRFRTLMEEHREVSRAGGESTTEQLAAEIVGAAHRPTRFVGYEKTDVLTAVIATGARVGSRRLLKLEESPFYAAGGGQVSDDGYLQVDGEDARYDVVEVLRFGDDQVLIVETGDARSVRRRHARARGRDLEHALPDDGQPHRHAPAARGAARGARRPRQAGRLGRAARQAALRLLAHRGADRRGARAGRAARQREGVRGDPGAHVRDADRGGAQARRDDALRREVRRRGARGRDRRLLARALRRHARPLDGRDRAVRDPQRGLGRLGRAPHRGGHRGRGVGAPARPRARARRRARRARAGAARGEEAEEGRARRPTSSPRSSVVGETNVIVMEVPGVGGQELLDLSDRFKQRSAPAAIVLGSREDGNANLVVNFDETVAGKLSAGDVVKEIAPLVGGGGGGRPTMARAGGKDPDNLPTALARARELIAAALS